MTTGKVVELGEFLRVVSIDKNSFVPLYRQIADSIHGAIARGELKPKELLPSEEEIAEALGVAKMTVRQALLELKREGLLYRRRGLGTFVAFPKFEHSLSTLVSFSEDIRSRGMCPGSRILFFGEVLSDAAIASHLGIKEGEPVLRIHRLRLADDQPVGIHDAYLPGDISIAQHELEKRGSLYALLQEKGFQLVEAEETIEAIQANSFQAELLGLGIGAPLLKVVRTVFSNEHRPIEHVIAIYRSDLYRYRIRLKRGSSVGGG
jgi:GntR family transcriptional regulator